MSLKKIRSAMAILRDQLASNNPLNDVTLLSDGTTIFAAHSADEVVDVFQKRTGRVWDRSWPGTAGARRRDPPTLPGGPTSCCGDHGGEGQLSSEHLDESQPADLVDFAHESERQFARLLDFYEVEWEYEPREFAIKFDDDGEPTKFFRPDFYLPDEDVYIEITTMSQKLVTKKNKKLRLLRELYPEIECKLFYQRDYLNLLVKYGLADLPDQELAGGADPFAGSTADRGSR